jgi:hypothetical protein
LFLELSHAEELVNRRLREVLTLRDMRLRDHLIVETRCVRSPSAARRSWLHAAEGLGAALSPADAQALRAGASRRIRQPRSKLSLFSAVRRDGVLLDLSY